jgi:hypothetical protein
MRGVDITATQLSKMYKGHIHPDGNMHFGMLTFKIIGVHEDHDVDGGRHCCHHPWEEVVHEVNEADC